MRSGSKVTKLGLWELLKNSCIIQARGPRQDSRPLSQLHVSGKPINFCLLLINFCLLFELPLESLPRVVLIRFRIPPLESVCSYRLLFL